MAPDPAPLPSASDWDTAQSITVVLADGSVESVLAASAAHDDGGALLLFAGGPSVPLHSDVMVAQYAPGTWRSWYTEGDDTALADGLAHRYITEHPLRALRATLVDLAIAHWRARHTR